MVSFRIFPEGLAGRWDLLTACVEEKGLKCASVWKNGVNIYEGDKGDREIRFGQGSECRSLLLVTSEIPIRDQVEMMRGS